MNEHQTFLRMDPDKLCIRPLRFVLEMNGLTEPHPYSWIKHAVRRWKEFYYEILETDGQTEWVNPLSAIFSHDNLALKAVDAPPTAPESVHKKQELSSPADPTPTSQPNPKTKRKQRQGRFFVKIKEIQAFLVRPGNPF